MRYQPQLRAFERFIPFDHRFLVLEAPHLVRRLARIFADMELVLHHALFSTEFACVSREVHPKN